MGLFSDKKIITVSSTLYNMAGDENDRADFLKGTLFSSVMANSPSIAESVTTAHFNGPGMKQRQFFKYADRTDMSGLPTATIVNTVAIDPSTVSPHIPTSAVPPAPAGMTLSCFSAEVLNGEFQPWCERWILENHPTRIGEDWLGEYDKKTNMFSVEFPNNDFYTWLNDILPVYTLGARYIAARYVESVPTSEAAVETGTPTTGVLTSPVLTGWTQLSDTATGTGVTLTRNRTTTLTYSNGDPAVVTESGVPANVATTLSTAEEVWQREVPITRNGLEIQGERQIWNLTGTDYVGTGYSNTVVTYQDMGGGVTQTTTATTTGERVIPRWTTRYDTQDIFIGSTYGSEQVYIYLVGSGNAVLDGLVFDTDATNFQEFYPFMPIRIDNVAIDEPGYEDLYAEMKKGYRRAYPGKNIDGLLEAVADNPSIDDIDYAYLCFGASLNVKEMACRRYIFNFLEKILPFQQAGSGTAMSGMEAQKVAYAAALVELQLWQNIVDNNDDWAIMPARPELPVITPPPMNTIRLVDTALGFDYRLTWIHMEIAQFSGTFDMSPALAGKQASKRDDVLLVNGPTFSYDERSSYNSRDEEIQITSNTIPSMYIYWQVDSNTYRRLQVWGLVSQNYIYGGKCVEITSAEALDDTDESGFLVPLHYPTMTEMGIVDYTQMSTANAHIMFNSYEVTTQKWYEKGIFKILLVIAIIIVAVIVFPGAFAAGGGVLGGNLAIGSALGLTGTAALVAGVVANYIASIIIAEILKIVGTALFGEKWGALFAAIAGFALGMATSGTSMFSAKGILGLSNALANGYAGYVQADIAEKWSETQELGETYEERMDYIQDLIDGLGQGNGLNFNPMFLTDGRGGNGRGGSGGYMPETSDQFIRRTTMTGSDVVDLTHAMVYDYVELQRTLPRN